MLGKFLDRNLLQWSEFEDKQKISLKIKRFYIQHKIFLPLVYKKPFSITKNLLTRVIYTEQN